MQTWLIAILCIVGIGAFMFLSGIGSYFFMKGFEIFDVAITKRIAERRDQRGKKKEKPAQSESGIEGKIFLFPIKKNEFEVIQCEISA